MKAIIGGSFAILLVISCLIFFSKGQTTNLFLPEIVDSPHKEHINPLFEKADAAKYAQDYKKADSEFRKLLSEKLSTADSQYMLNQLAYINLTMNEDSIAHQWMELFEKTTRPLSISAQADNNYNVGTWAYHTFKPKMAEKYLKDALSGYRNIYGGQHLKVAQCLTQIGHLFYEFSDYPDSIFNYMPLAYDIFQTSQSLKNFSGNTELGMVYINFMRRNIVIGHHHAENAMYLLSNTPYIDTITLARATSFNGQMIKKIADFTVDTVTKAKLYNEAESYFKKALSTVKETHPRFQEMMRNYLIINIFKHDSTLFFINLEKLRNNVKKYGNYYAYEERLLGNYYYNGYRKSKTENIINNYSLFLKKYEHDSLVGHVLKTEAFYCLITAFRDTSSFMYNHKKAIHYANCWLKGNNRYNDDLGLASVPYNAMYSFIPLNLIANSYWEKYLKFGKLKDLFQTIQIYKRTDSLLFNTINVLENNVMIEFQQNIGNSLYPTALKAVHEFYRKTGNKQYLEDAFLFSERMKSGILFRDIELLDKNDSIAFFKSELEKLIGENEVHQSKNYSTSDRITSLNRRLEKSMLMKTSQSINQFPSIRTLKEQLTPNQAILQYNLDNEQYVLHVLYISKDTVFFYQFQSKDLKNKLISYQNCMKNYNQAAKDKDTFSEISYYLYQKLILPFENDLNKRTDWIIIPDRNLHQIPFESLITSKQFNDYNKMSYLINKPNLTISYSPSWKIYQLNLAKQDVSVSDNLLYFTTLELPCAEFELNSVKTLWGKQANFYTGRNCSKNVFLNSWHQNYGILHLSLHAQGKTDSIFNNKIWFQSNKQDALYGFELTGTHTPIKLVVLSACETNVGNSGLGEGVYSMARYFFQSSAKVVIASLWQIEDCPNSQIMNFFYKQLKAGKKPKQALCEAKRLFLKEVPESTLAYPGYWAGMVCLD